MRDFGKVGPEHARKPATLNIFSQDVPTHALSQKTYVLPADLRIEAEGMPPHPGHRLFLAVPRGTPPAGGWPILYMLDGNAAFDFLTPDHLALVPDLVLVGIGYDSDRQFLRERRTLDFTAPDRAAAGADARGLRPDPVHEGRIAGGAEAFHRLLTGVLRDLAEEGLAIDPARRTLWGHSFGGLFTLYALLAHPQSFARFASISPSIWWDEALIHRVREAAQRLDPAPEVLLALGDKEKRSGSEGPPPDGPAPATMEFFERLKAQPGYEARVHVLKDHVHIQTLAGSFAHALPFGAKA